MSSLTTHALVLLVVVCPSLSGVAQKSDGTQLLQGKPRVIHYNRKDFNNDPQIWTMCQDDEGILYFGSNSGTLIFDGEKWQSVPLPNNSSVRSLFKNSQGVIYAGGFNEFGRIKKNDIGQYHYESDITLLRQEDRNFENIWSIHEVQGHMVFRGYRSIIAVAGAKALNIPSISGTIDYSTVLDGKLYINDADGIKTLNLSTLEFTSIINKEAVGTETILTIVPGNSEREGVLFTRQGSIYNVQLNSGALSRIAKLDGFASSNRINYAIKASSGIFYLGTLSNKVVSLDLSGNHVSGEATFHDLQDNTVHSLFETGQGNIWALLNNGIDCIDVNSPVTQIYGDASIADVLVNKKDMYLATNQGVLRADPVGPTLFPAMFTNLAGLEGQAWSLQEFEGGVVCGHDLGVIVLSGKGYERVAGPRGVWKVIPIAERKDHYLVCTYEGLHLMRYSKSDGFEILHKLEGFNESTRDILQDQPGVFWICHGYKGVFRVMIDQDYKRIVGIEHFQDKHGLPSPFNINVFQWQNEKVFTTNQGVFAFDKKDNRFKPHAKLSRIFGTDKNVRQLFEFGDKTWFVHDDEVGYFNTASANQAELQKGLFLQLKGTLNQSMECIVPLSETNVLVGTREGLYAFDLAYEPSHDHITLLTSIGYHEGNESGNAVLLPLNSERKVELAHNATTIRFGFAVPSFDDKLNIQYSFKLDAVNQGWSTWQEAPYAEFTMLPPGTYTFRVKGRSLLGESASETVYKFSILPVWYKTRLAYVIYFFISALVIALLVRTTQRRIDSVRRKTIAEEEEKRKVLELELQHIKLEREKAEIIKGMALLEEDVVFKSKELANYTMLLVKKRELLNELQEKLNQLLEVVKNDQARGVVRELLKKINSNLQNEEHLKVFEANFERVHQEFFAQLKSTFPDLTAKELQLCAFVKMNLSNKEIASILNLSVRGVETARYRLRKRLGLTHEEDMAAFLEKLHASQDQISDPE